MQQFKMERIKNKIIRSFLIFSIFIVLVLPLISSIGVGCMYLGSEMPLEMYAGEEKIVVLNLGNSDINDEITLKGEILQGSEISSLKKDTFKVPYKSKDVFAELIINMPENAKIGEIYNIRYKFKQIAGGLEEEGMVSFGQGIEMNFDINVVEKSEQPAPTGGLNWTWIILGIVLIVVVVIIIKFFIKSKNTLPPK